MRFHLIAAVYVIIFSLMYGLSKAQWGVVLVLIGAVIAAELFNTSIEQVCNLYTKDYNPTVKFAKDAAAGAVLVLSFAAVAAAAVIFTDSAKLAAVWTFVINRPWLLILFIVSFIISIAFIAMGPKGLKKILNPLKFDNK